MKGVSLQILYSIHITCAKKQIADILVRALWLTFMDCFVRSDISPLYYF